MTTKRNNVNEKKFITKKYQTIAITTLIFILFAFGVESTQYRLEANRNIPPSFFEAQEIPDYYPQAHTTKFCNDKRFDIEEERPLPDFYLIGGAKCGTTSFSEYIRLFFYSNYYSMMKRKNKYLNNEINKKKRGASKR